MKRWKKTRKTMFQMVMVDFAGVFLALVLILTTIFLTFSFRRTKKDYLQYNQMLLKSIESRLDSYFSSLEDSSRSILANETLWEVVTGFRDESRRDLEEQLRIACSNMYYYSYHIQSIRLYLPKTKSLYSMNRDVLINDKPFVRCYETLIPEEKKWIETASGAAGSYQYAMDQEGDLMVSVALSSPFEKKTAFAFQYTLAGSFWKELIRDLKTEEEEVLILNKNYNFYYSSRDSHKNYIPLIQEKIEREQKEKGWLNIRLEEKCLVEYTNWQDSDWIVAKVIPLSNLYSAFTTNISMYGLCGLLAVLFMICVSVSISKKISRPIENLTASLEAVTPEHFELDAVYEKNNEIGALYSKCHENIRMIQNLIKKEYQLNLSEKEARLKILQLQLNPHFIYNVLQLLSNIAVESDNTEIEEITDAFGLLLRYNLANENRKVRVAEEVEALTHYFFIIQKTYGKRLEVWTQIEEDTKALEMIPFVLQPIVENAFKHGLSRKVGQIKIRVRVWKEKEVLMLSVGDNGIGMERNEVDKINGFSMAENVSGDIVGGKGIRLIQERIELEYGKPFGVFAESWFNMGTVITVSLPAQETSQKGE